MTAEKFLKSKKYPSFNNAGGIGIGYCHQAMIEFAKFHVESALKAAASDAHTKDVPYTDDVEVDKESILTAYPLENIK